MDLELSLEDDVETDEVIELYKANGWLSAEKPEKLFSCLKKKRLQLYMKFFLKSNLRFLVPKLSYFQVEIVA